MTIITMPRNVRFIALSFLVSYLWAQDSYDISSVLMRSTYRITDGKSSGTAFLLGNQIDGVNHLVLVTAEHVLADMPSEEVTLFLRKKSLEGYEILPHRFKIRNGEKKRWHTHPSADIAVMYISFPPNADLSYASMALLPTDEFLKNIEIRPGETVFTLGYPLSIMSNEAGFPIQRTGTIASYPILPTKNTKYFLMDFEVYPGNSGGPVFMISQGRYYAGEFHVGQMQQVILGLVSQQSLVRAPLYQEETRVHPLKLGAVVHASLIREAIHGLPKPE